MRHWLLLFIALITTINAEQCVNGICPLPQSRQLYRDCNFDGLCDPDEDPYGCSDCDGRAIASICGNGACEADEEFSCPDDCRITANDDNNDSGINCPSGQISDGGGGCVNDCSGLSGSSWDDSQQRCVCASQHVDNGNGECVHYNIHNGCSQPVGSVLQGIDCVCPEGQWNNMGYCSMDTCGDGMCTGNEDWIECSTDCQRPDGCIVNGICEESYGETYSNCLSDCPTPPNPCNDDGTCQIESGEDSTNCSNDCGCNNDGNCESWRNEDWSNCPHDCPNPNCNYNGICESNNSEDSNNCFNDCNENQNYCNNNGVCENDLNENFINCHYDCNPSPCNNDGMCDAGEDYKNCPNDCSACPGTADPYGYIGGGGWCNVFESTTKMRYSCKCHAPAINYKNDKNEFDIECNPTNAMWYMADTDYTMGVGECTQCKDTIPALTHTTRSVQYMDSGYSYVVVDYVCDPGYVYSFTPLDSKFSIRCDGINGWEPYGECIPDSSTYYCGNGFCEANEDCRTCPHDCSTSLIAAHRIDTCHHPYADYRVTAGFEVGMAGEGYGWEFIDDALKGDVRLHVPIGFSGIEVGSVMVCSPVHLIRKQQYFILTNGQLILVTPRMDDSGNEIMIILAIYDPDGTINVAGCPSVSPSALPSSVPSSSSSPSSSALPSATPSPTITCNYYSPCSNSNGPCVNDCQRNLGSTCGNGICEAGEICSTCSDCCNLPCWSTYDATISGYQACNTNYALSGEQCTWSYAATPVYTCKAGETLTAANTCEISATQNYCTRGSYIGGGACEYSVAATAACASGWSKSGSYCQKQQCGANQCGQTSDSGSPLACFTSTCKGDAKNTGSGWSCYTTDGGPGGFWGLMNGNGACGSSSVTFKCFTSSGTKTCSAPGGGGFLYRAGSTSTDVCYCRDAFPQGYTCASGMVSGSSCIINEAATYQCPVGYSLSGTTCVRQADISSYRCSSAGTVNGNMCTDSYNAIPIYSCLNGGTLSSSTCTIECTSTATATVTPSNTPSRTKTPTSSTTSTGTMTGSPTPSTTSTSSETSTVSGSPTPSTTSTSSLTSTATGSPTSSTTSTSSLTSTATGSPTPSTTSTSSLTSTSSETSTATGTSTSTSTMTSSPTSSTTSTSSLTSTATGSPTPSTTSTSSLTSTATGSPTSSTTSTSSETSTATGTTTGSPTPSTTSTSSETSTVSGSPTSSTTSTSSLTSTATGTTTGSPTPSTTSTSSETSTATGTSSKTSTSSMTISPTPTYSSTSSIQNNTNTSDIDIGIAPESGNMNIGTSALISNAAIGGISGALSIVAVIIAVAVAYSVFSKKAPVKKGKKKDTPFSEIEQLGQIGHLQNKLNNTRVPTQVERINITNFSNAAKSGLVTAPATITPAKVSFNPVSGAAAKAIGAPPTVRAIQQAIPLDIYRSHNINLDRASIKRSPTTIKMPTAVNEAKVGFQPVRKDYRPQLARTSVAPKARNAQLSVIDK